MNKKKVLLVDDDPDFIESIEESLKSAGYDIDTAYDGKQALLKVANAVPDIIVLDIMMPVMNGHKFCRAIKGNPQTSHIPILLLTSVAEHVTSSNYTHYDMLSSDADDYLQKPVSLKELVGRINYLLQR